jgi:thiol:disulfide interchange protein DsbG
MGNQVKGTMLFAVTMLLAACGGKSDAPVAQAAAGVPAVTVAASTPAAPAMANADGPTQAEQYLMKQGVKISQAFVSRSSLKAIVADNGAERRLFYVTPDGQSLISGMVFDLNGQNITSEDMARFNVKDVGGNQVLSDMQLEDLWKRAGELQYIAEGEGRPVYVVFDPNCPYCHQLWRSLREVAASGKVQVRWVPVAILSESSKNLAAALYQTKSPLASLTELGLGSLGAAPVIEKASADALARNLLLLRDTGYTGVPTLLWKEGDKIKVRMEVPDAQQFASIFH